MKQILLIDDDAFVRVTVCAILNKSGYSVTCATNGEEGAEIFRALKPDLVITDIIMPNREGIETILLIRREHPAARIIAMSGGGRIGSADLLTMARELGADHVLRKPFDMDTLIATVRESLSS
jgi:two-component system chemotaxis response regulator CheY